MSKLRPFRALRPQPEKAALVSAVPYDVVSTSEAAELSRGNPLSFLHLSRPEKDLPPGTDPYSDAVYGRARTEFDRIRREAPLVREAEPSIYLYRLRMGSHVQTGIAASYSIDEYDAGTIRKHERTRQDKEDDRTRHVRTLSAQTGPVFLAYRGRDAINAEVTKLCASTAPLFDFTAPDGVAHTLWKVSDRTVLERLTAEFARVPMLYIADGHHRAASASRVHRELGPSGAPDADRDHFLAVAFPMEQLRILPYHRVLKDLNGRTPEQLLEQLARDFELAPDAGADAPHGEFRMYLGGRWYGLAPRTRPDPSDPIAALDVSVLQERVLTPIFGIRDPRTDKRIDFVGGIRGTAELQAWVDSGRAAVAFSMHPTSMEELLRVADANGIMPPKSTWFEPKLRDGLLTHTFE